MLQRHRSLIQLMSNASEGARTLGAVTKIVSQWETTASDAGAMIAAKDQAQAARFPLK